MTTDPWMTVYREFLPKALFHRLTLEVLHNAERTDGLSSWDSHLEDMRRTTYLDIPSIFD